MVSKHKPTGYLPPRCCSCGEKLDNVDWVVENNYTFNPEHDCYEPTSKAFPEGFGEARCPYCKQSLSDMEGLEEGPLNYEGSDDIAQCRNCKYIDRDENDDPLVYPEEPEYRCHHMGDNGAANNIDKARHPSECCAFHPYRFKIHIYHGETPHQEFWESKPPKVLLMRDKSGDRWVTATGSRTQGPTLIGGKSLIRDNLDELIKAIEDENHVKIIKDTSKEWRLPTKNARKMRLMKK